ncbi:hypothetical protein BHE74_00059777, partial [Ensete ventricosum]
MGDHGGCAQLTGLLVNGLLSEETAKLTRVLDADRWVKAEGQTAELIARIQPNQSSEERRNAVANYVQRLILKCFSCQKEKKKREKKRKKEREKNTSCALLFPPTPP